MSVSYAHALRIPPRDIVHAQSPGYELMFVGELAIGEKLDNSWHRTRRPGAKKHRLRQGITVYSKHHLYQNPAIATPNQSSTDGEYEKHGSEKGSNTKP